MGFEGGAFAVPVSGSPMVASGVWEVYCNLGDYIELDLWYSSEPASNLSWSTTAGTQSRIELTWMGI
ncbi:hypothetical protein EBO15_01550 [Actinomadura harenae]|uniref:Uncharacterized protein n=1 Tax=Actinomadura harenae TaxID=2483351 RepID=A0A3M2MD22_9ACTN|nr:hypothetical protein EBO15_01550 [Actinomadura harenae]